jgi:hypothetical protein
MCQVIKHYVDLIDFTMFKDFDKTNQIAGGICLWTEFSYLNNGLEGHPKKSTMSNFASIFYITKFVKCNHS